MKVPSLVHSLHPSIEMLESPASTVHVMALRSGNRSRRWKSPSTPNTPARSAGRTPSSVPLSASGTARPARRSSLVAPGPSRECHLPNWFAHPLRDFISLTVPHLITSFSTTAAATIRSTVRRLRELLET
ncbi:hypothetical protein BC938DRAFT_481299 [Jimgerdemannia flammicorona]|uniref:Uncharacterized protein n=1 Tax=Jimgerdemannia flammicorona TaxID=994334 RepID=A0A433QGP5_9FUNG|nr:hypothetical protein BC938DRAFT_481299 [Jimgerdemannia flammicorona]